LEVGRREKDKSVFIEIAGKMLKRMRESASFGKKLIKNPNPIPFRTTAVNYIFK